MVAGSQLGTVLEAQAGELRNFVPPSFVVWLLLLWLSVSNGGMVRVPTTVLLCTTGCSGLSTSDVSGVSGIPEKRAKPFVRFVTGAWRAVNDALRVGLVGVFETSL
jgi:hypothetical protein